jgi:hypothetical protein
VQGLFRRVSCQLNTNLLNHVFPAFLPRQFPRRLVALNGFIKLPDLGEGGGAGSEHR